MNSFSTGLFFIMQLDRRQSIAFACLVLKYNRLCVQSSLLEFVFLISKLDYHPLNEMVIKPLFYILCLSLILAGHFWRILIVLKYLK